MNVPVMSILLIFCCVGVFTWLSIKAFDEFLVFIIFCHSYYSSQILFDDYESELSGLAKSRTLDSDTDSCREVCELRGKLAADLEKYRLQVNACPWKYRFCKAFFYESHLANTYMQAI